MFSILLVRLSRGFIQQMLLEVAVVAKASEYVGCKPFLQLLIMLSEYTCGQFLQKIG